MTVYGLYVKYPKGIDMREVTELIGLFTTKELAEKMLDKAFFSVIIIIEREEN